MRTSRMVRLSVVELVLLRRMRRELSISVVWRSVFSLKAKIAERGEGALRQVLLEAVSVSSLPSRWICCCCCCLLCSCR
jgi:hypothetical protein